MHETSMKPAARSAAEFNLRRKKNSAHAAVNTRSRKRAPAIRALKRGDASTIRSLNIAAALMLAPPLSQILLRARLGPNSMRVIRIPGHYKGKPDARIRRCAETHHHEAGQFHSGAADGRVVPEMDQRGGAESQQSPGGSVGGA